MATANTSYISHSSAIESALATLQPIRDLSRNWDVDIASCLEEYLQELVGVPTLDQHQHPQDQSKQDGSAPNFAHAALILQNSSNVYSRKVEYLHGLVYKALYEFFKSTSTNSNSKEARRRSADSAIEEFLDFDPHVDFLLLDDVVPEDLTSRKINLKEDDDDEDELGNDLGGSTPNQSMTRTRISLGGLSVTRVEQRSSIGGFGGFASSSQQRALLGTLNNGSLRLVDGRCDVGDDGVLFMPGSSSAPSSMNIGEPSTGGRRSLFGDELTAPEPNNSDGHCDYACDDYDDHSNDGPGFDFGGADDDHDGPDLVEEVTNTLPGSTLAVADHQQRRRDANNKRVTFQDIETQKKTDPWALLDPHSSENSTVKPLKKGKTYRLPKNIDLPPSECVTGASTRRMPNRRPPIEEGERRLSVAAETFRALLGEEWEPPKIPLNGLAFGDEFAYIAKKAAKKRAELRRALRKEEQQKERPLDNQNTIAPYDDYDEHDDDDYGGGYDFGGGDDDYDDDNDDMGGNVGMTSLDDAFRNAAGGKDDAESNLGKTFEELCRAHIQAFAKGAEAFALSTQLSDRVGKWQSKLAPILEEEEQRASFDIHLYSEKIIDTAHNGVLRVKRKSDGSKQLASRTVNFEAVTQNCTKSDVCRMFLASLSLANAGNIKIDEGAADYRFDLVSTLLERPMETYQAPSLVQDS